MNKTKIILLALLTALCIGVQAQTNSETPTEQQSNPRGFYLGAQAHSPLMWGDLFSLGKETRPGYGGGVFAGYTIGGWFSPELSFDYGIGRLGAKEHQINDYFNKAGIIKYVQYDPSDMKLGDIYSKAQYMQAGLRLQMGLISLIRGGHYTPFDIELAPAIYAQKFSPTLYAAADNKKLDGYGIAESGWNYAAGGDLGLRYRFSPKVSAHLRGGLLWMRNEAFEGVNNDPLWRVNLMANASVGVTFHLGKTAPNPVKTDGRPSMKTDGQTSMVPPAPDDSDQKAAEAERLRQEQLAREQAEKEAQAKMLADAEKQRMADAEAKAKAYQNEVAALRIPPVYFRRGSAVIHKDINEENLNEILRVLHAYPETAIRIEGWCDVTGTERINALLSQQRADSLRNYLTGKGIDYQRFASAKGMGVDEAGGYSQEARRVVVTLSLE